MNIYKNNDYYEIMLVDTLPRYAWEDIDTVDIHIGMQEYLVSGSWRE